jgi:hypothetical protein
MFLTESFHLLLEQTNFYYQQHLDGQAGTSRPLSDITLSGMVTFVALALQMGHELKDTTLKIKSPVINLGKLPLYGGIDFGIKELMLT